MARAISIERNIPPKPGRRIEKTLESAPVPSPGSAIRIRKLRPDRSGVVVRAEFALPQLELGYATFRTGDVFAEFYSWDRWYTLA